MRVEVVIDELLFDGAAPAEPELLVAAVERRLAALVAERGLPGRLQEGGPAGRPVAVREATADVRAGELAPSVADAIYGALPA